MPTKAKSETKQNWISPLVQCKYIWIRPPQSKLIQHLKPVLRPIRDLTTRRSLGALLIAYTIFVDSLFAVSSVTSQLFISEVHPDALEYSLYSLAQTLLQAILPILFLGIQTHLSIRLETWMIIGYVLILIVPIWGCIGLSNIDFGFKVSTTSTRPSSTNDVCIESLGVLSSTRSI